MAEKKIICDTDVMIDYWDMKQVRHISTKKILEEKIGLGNIVLSAITKMELMSGATNKLEMDKINKKLSRFNIALINNEITLKAFQLLHLYHLSHKLSLPDSFIASTAIIAQLELFSYNRRDFKYLPHLVLFKH